MSAGQGESTKLTSSEAGPRYWMPRQCGWKKLTAGGIDQAERAVDSLGAKR